MILLRLPPSSLLDASSESSCTAEHHAVHRHLQRCMHPGPGVVRTQPTAFLHIPRSRAHVPTGPSVRALPCFGCLGSLVSDADAGCWRACDMDAVAGAASGAYAGRGRRGVAARCSPPDRSRSPRTRKAPPSGAFRECAEEDSNLHPVIPDQALNLARLPIPPSARGRRRV